AGEIGLPQVVSLGALDMVNFGPRETVPEQFEGRNLYVHNPTVTLMRTTPEECAELGRQIACKLFAATGPTALFVPLKGVSMIAVEGQAFHDPAADEALFAAVREGLGANVELHELDTDVNDPAFADAMAAEVLPVVYEAPVLAGVCGTDPFRLMPVFLDELKRIGFSGVQNFPTVGLIDGNHRIGLEETGMGYGVEVEMIRAAHAADL